MPKLFGLERNALGEPRQLCVHRDTLSLDGSAAGNQADLQLNFRMPSNVIWQLYAFNAYITGMTVTPQYILGELQMFSTPIPGLSPRQQKYTLFLQTGSAIVQGEVPTMYITLGGSLQGSDPINLPGFASNGPYRTFVQGQTNQTSEPTLFLGSGNGTNVASDTFLTYEAVWRGFYVEDLDTAALYSQ